LPRFYDLRHSFATQTYRGTGDAKATVEMLMHGPNSKMVDRYTIAGVDNGSSQWPAHSTGL
jgi:integrase